jgi:hypothetical protein
MEQVEIALQENDFKMATHLMRELLKLTPQIAESNQRQETRSQVDSLRTLLHEQVIRKIQFSGDKTLVTFARDHLKIEDVVTPFLEF